MAHKKGQGSSRNGRDSPGQHRGIKIYGGQLVTPGNIIVRQVGTVVHPGRGAPTCLNAPAKTYRPLGLRGLLALQCFDRAIASPPRYHSIACGCLLACLDRCE